MTPEQIFIAAYVSCALELLTDDEGIDLHKNRDDIDADTLRCMECEAFAFFYACGHCFNGNDSQAGYDLWLTRNGYGTGFWDRDKSMYGDAAAFLTNAAQRAGERSLYLGDDGLVYQTWG